MSKLMMGTDLVCFFCTNLVQFWHMFFWYIFGADFIDLVCNAYWRCKFGTIDLVCSFIGGADLVQISLIWSIILLEVQIWFH